MFDIFIKLKTKIWCVLPAININAGKYYINTRTIFRLVIWEASSYLTLNDWLESCLPFMCSNSVIDHGELKELYFLTGMETRPIPRMFVTLKQFKKLFYST